MLLVHCHEALERLATGQGQQSAKGARFCLKGTTKDGVIGPMDDHTVKSLIERTETGGEAGHTAP